MCIGIKYSHNNRQKLVYFHQPFARLPVMTSQGRVALLPWGRHLNQPGNLPLGGCVNVNKVVSGKWDAYFPRPVKVPALGFMEKDIEERSHWHELVMGQWIQAALTRYDNECRVYIVVVEPQLDNALYHRWPRIVSDRNEMSPTVKKTSFL